jgi:regulator of sigma E protease
MSWLVVFGGLCALIMLHEAGHFFAAKATGMRVERFFLFFPPKIASFKRGKTEYGVGAIPLGGFVKISGMNPEEELPPAVEHRAYYRQPVWKRIVVIGAGPAVNIVLGLVILFFLFYANAKTADQEVRDVTAKSPAHGILMPGDRILAVDGSAYRNRDAMGRIDGFRSEIDSHRCRGRQVDGCWAANPVLLKVERNGKPTTISVRPRYSAAEGRALIGFAFGETGTTISPGEAIDRATGYAWLITHETLTRFARIFNSKERKEISGIVGVSDVGHQTVEKGATTAFFFLAVISLSLGLINLFPFLPLDGGHIFWALAEKVRGKKIPFSVMERAGVVGFVLILVLFVIGLSNDITGLSNGAFNVTH